MRIQGEGWVDVCVVGEREGGKRASCAWPPPVCVEKGRPRRAREGQSATEYLLILCGLRLHGGHWAFCGAPRRAERCSRWPRPRPPMPRRMAGSGRSKTRRGSEMAPWNQRGQGERRGRAPPSGRSSAACASDAAGLPSLHALRHGGAAVEVARPAATAREGSTCVPCAQEACRGARDLGLSRGRPAGLGGLGRRVRTEGLVKVPARACPPPSASWGICGLMGESDHGRALS